TDAQGFSPIGTPAHGGTTSQAIGSLTGFYTTSFGRDYLADVKSGLTFTRSAADPYLALPDGRALVVSSFPDGGGGVSTLQFGGNSGMHTDARAVRWETNAQVQMYPPGYLAHRVKFAGDLRYDGYSQDLFGN